MGFHLGCLAVQSFRLQLPAIAVADGSVIFSVPVWIVALLALWMGCRAALLLRPPGVGDNKQVAQLGALAARSAAQVWTPRTASVTIGLSFFVLLVAVGPWAYTDVMAEFAQINYTARPLDWVHARPCCWCCCVEQRWVAGRQDGSVVNRSPALRSRAA